MHGRALGMVLRRPGAVLANDARVVHRPQAWTRPSGHHRDSNPGPRRPRLRPRTWTGVDAWTASKQRTEAVRERRTRRTGCAASPATGGEARTGTGVPRPERIWAVRQAIAHTASDADGQPLISGAWEIGDEVVTAVGARRAQRERRPPRPSTTASAAKQVRDATKEASGERETTAIARRAAVEGDPGPVFAPKSTSHTLDGEPATQMTLNTLRGREPQACKVSVGTQTVAFTVSNATRYLRVYLRQDVPTRRRRRPTDRRSAIGDQDAVTQRLPADGQTQPARHSQAHPSRSRTRHIDVISVRQPAGASRSTNRERDEPASASARHDDSNRTRRGKAQPQPRQPRTGKTTSAVRRHECKGRWIERIAGAVQEDGLWGSWMTGIDLLSRGDGTIMLASYDVPETGMEKRGI
ncbi:hypothetical protein V8D89_009617 [Ganoderma adspersum]